MSPVVSVERLVKKYGSKAAVDGISFAVEAGEVFGIVGPNGAGKTTTIECLVGLRKPTSGDLRLLGQKADLSNRKLKQRIGVQLQSATVYGRLKVWEALDLFASFYDRTVPYEPLLEQLGLAEHRDAYFVRLSGGQKQRLFVALALLHDPELLFLDELTSGLDPHARRSVWGMIRGLKAKGKTILLSTHYMDEAEHLCDRVAIMSRGRIVALDTPARLASSLGDDVSRLVFEVEGDFPAAAVAAVPGVVKVEPNGSQTWVYGSGSRLWSSVLQAIEAQGCTIRSLTARPSTLEDVYLKLTDEGEGA